MTTEVGSVVPFWYAGQSAQHSAGSFVAQCESRIVSHCGARHWCSTSLQGVRCFLLGDPPNLLEQRWHSRHLATTRSSRSSSFDEGVPVSMAQGWSLDRNTDQPLFACTLTRPLFTRQGVSPFFLEGDSVKRKHRIVLRCLSVIPWASVRGLDDEDEVCNAKLLRQLLCSELISFFLVFFFF